MKISKEVTGNIREQDIFQYVFENDSGIGVKVLNYGGIITEIQTPDKQGKAGNIVLGFDSFEKYISKEYLDNYPYLGAIIGRYANRIAGAEFIIDGKKYQLAKNHGENHLHGGNIGYDKVIWEHEGFSNKYECGVKLSYKSKDNEESYPGNFDVSVTYTLNHHNELHIDYSGMTDKACHINLTQHTYFNLNVAIDNVLNHELIVNADHFTQVNDESIPTGKILPVAGTPLDFKQPQKIGARIQDILPGYDHNYILKKHKDYPLSFAARAKDEISGRTLQAYTTQPGMQLYTANFLDIPIPGAHGKPYGKHSGFCLETQHYPDSPHHPDFPSTLLRPGETFNQKTVYVFGVEK